MTEQELIDMGVDEYQMGVAHRKRVDEIDEEIERLEQEKTTLKKEAFPFIPKWQQYLTDKIDAKIKSIESGEGK